MATGDGWVGGISERPTDVNGALLCLSFFFSPFVSLSGARPLTTRTPEWEKEEKAFMSKQRAPTHQQRG